MPLTSTPFVIAALDAGSNAIRATVARATSATEIRELASARWAVRLGHGVFTKRRLNSRRMVSAVEALRQFRNLMERYDADRYCAVATSAVREAANRDLLISRALRETGVELKAVSADEEARLVREAVFATAGGRLSPRVIVDLGGGSLEVSLLRGRKVKQALALPLGTVRLMEMFGQTGAFTPESYARVRRHVLAQMSAHHLPVSRLGGAMAVACGGNAEALARLAAGNPSAGFNTLNLRRLEDRLWEILKLDVEQRMDAFRVRRDRAEVMGVAAVVFTALGQWLGIRQWLVPGVGVREGVLHDLAAAHFGPATAYDERAEAIRQQARRFAVRMHCDAAHCEQVRRLAAQLFDQLAEVHEMPAGQRVPLEIAALLHSVGLAVNVKAHHKHAEYLVRNADIPGLSGHQQALIASVVRYQGEASPKPHHRVYRSLGPAERRRVLQLAALLRMAIVLDAGGTQAVRRIEARVQRKGIWLGIATVAGAHLDVHQLRRSARLFEHEFGLPVRFKHVRLEKPRRGPSVAGESNGSFARMRNRMRSRARRSQAVLRRRPAA